MTELQAYRPDRATLVPRNGRAPDWLLNQLPVGLLGSDFFVRFVSLFQALGETLVADADNVENVIDLGVAPDELVRWLASWIGLADIDPALPDTVQRNIVGGSARALAWRGTPTGLTTYLERITGGPVLVRDGGGVWREGEAPAGTAWVTMELATTGLLSEAAVAELVSDEVPAHVDARLYVGERLIWSSQEQAR